MSTAIPSVPLPSESEAVPKILLDGTHRAADLRDTARRVSPFKKVMGITRTADLTGLDRLDIPTVAVYRPNARSLSVAQGKGTSLEAARVSGLMEATEFYHAERVTLPLLHASFTEVRFRHVVCDLAGLPVSRMERFHPELRILWVEARNLQDGSFLKIPYESVHLDCTLPLPTGSGCFEQSSTGLASGNHILEAVAHALCEIVERDADARHQAGGRAAFECDLLALDTVDDLQCCRLLDKFHRADVDVMVWDITTSVGVAAFRCLILDRQDSFHQVLPSGGLGCHPSREVALSRALTEAAQSRMTWISGSRDDLLRGRFEALRSPDQLAELHRERASISSGRRFQDVPSRSFASFREEVSWLLERLDKASYQQVLAVDLTHPIFQIPVVKIVIPHALGVHYR